MINCVAMLVIIILVKMEDYGRKYALFTVTTL